MVFLLMSYGFVLGAVVTFIFMILMNVGYLNVLENGDSEQPMLFLEMTEKGYRKLKRGKRKKYILIKVMPIKQSR